MSLAIANHHTYLGQFVEALYQARNINEAFSAFEQHVIKLGFEGALYTFIPRISLDTNFPHAPVYLVSENYSPKYLDHYMDACFYQHDPAIKAIEKGELTPFDWWEEIHKGKMNKVEQGTIVTAREDYQIMHGITIPTMSDNRGIAGASFISSENDRLYGKLKAVNLEQLQLCTQLFHSAVLSKSFLVNPFIQPLIEKLTTKEKGLLRGLSAGKSMKTIALELETEVRYLDKVLRHTREKFSEVELNGQAKINKNQLVYYMGLLNLLDHL
ncbi:MAG: hypothetical protein GQ583_02560 [Methyloprofundus sp.]|nr:hypothetical protein [Methyloprofundus sp.]